MSDLPKCFDILNDGYFANMQDALHATGNPVQFQQLINDIFADLSLLISTITSQIEALGPIAALLQAPTDLAAVISWINDLINSVLGPYIIAYAKLVAQVAAITQMVADIQATIESIKDLKFPDIDIEIPSITIGCKL